MRLLFLTPQLPYPPRQGTTIRNFGLIRHLAQRHTIDLITFLAPGDLLSGDNPLHTLCRRVAAIPQPVRSMRRRAWNTLTSPLPDMALRLESAAMHQLVHTWVAESTYDIIQVEGIEMAPYLATAKAAARTAPHPVHLVFDNHNCEYLLQKRNALNDLKRPARWLGGVYSLLQWWKLRRYEQWACRSATATLAVSRPDAEALRALVGSTARRMPDNQNPVIHVISNGIDIDTIDSYPDAIKTPTGLVSAPESVPEPVLAALPPTGHPIRLLFTGKMDYRPNVDAVLWFAGQVLPIILRHIPQTRFQVVGMNPHPRLAGLAQNPNIEITGAVDDIQPYIQNTSIFVIPLRVGGGTRFKILEAMAAAKPIVSTSLGAEGIPIESGQHLLLADTPDHFAQAVINLAHDQASAGRLSHRLGTAARAFVAKHYAWESIIPKLEEIYAQFSANHAAPSLQKE